VLVNDFGEVDVDSELIVGVAAQKVSFANGCVCCETRDDLLAAIEAVLGSEAGIDAIVLEASGVAGPMAIARMFVDAAYQRRLRLDGIIAVVDAEQLAAQIADPARSDLVYGQIGCSDLVLLNKIDLALRARVDEVRDVRDRAA
jgi:G3E family GTPase